jgi:hypothetical protein
VTLLTCLAFVLLASSSYFLVVAKQDMSLLEVLAQVAIVLASSIGFTQFMLGDVDFNPVSRTMIWATALLQSVNSYKFLVELSESPLYEEDKS